MRYVAELIAGLIMTFILTIITLPIANGPFQQSWDFWPVFTIWAFLVFIGFVIFEVSGGEISLPDIFD